MYRIDKLLKANQKLFHTSDIALLWGITNKNTLYTTIKRYITKGVLIPIHKGFYSTVPIDEIDPIRVGVGYLHNFAYLSCESVLFNNGIIFQQSIPLTLVSFRSVRFVIAGQEYLVRQLVDKFLYNPLGVTEINGIYQATTERAVADLFYFAPHYYLDNRDKINWQEVKKIQKEVYFL